MIPSKQTDKLPMVFSRVMEFPFKNHITECTSQSVGLVIDGDVYEAL
jgi:hypothetical protein